MSENPEINKVRYDNDEIEVVVDIPINSNMVK